MKLYLLKSVVVTMAIGCTTSIIAQTNASTIDTIVSKTDSVPSVIDIPKIASNGVKMSLEDCIAIALSENPTIKVADMEIERLDYSKKETFGQLLPSLAFSGQYSRTIAKQTMYLNMSALSGLGGGGGSGETEATEEAAAAAAESASAEKKGIKMGLDNSYSLGFNATMPIVAPQLWKALHLSDTQILQNIEAARSSRLSLVNQVKNAYYTLLLAIDSQSAILESYENAKFTADIYKKKKALGAASEFDVLRADVALKAIEPSLLQGEIGVKSACLQLCLLMGMSQAIAIVPTTRLSDYEKTMYENTLALDRSIDDNTNLRQLDLNTRLLKENLDVQKAAWWPTLALSANYNWTSMSNGNMFKNFTWSPYSTVGIALSLPIYQGGQRTARIKQAEIQLNEMKWQRDNLVRTINLQVEVAIDNIQKNVKQITSSSENVIQAEKANEIQEKSFQIGAGTYLDLRDSRLALTRARLAYYQSIYDYLVAYSDLELLLGNADLDKYQSANKQ